MYICVIVSTVDVNDCIFCANEQQKVYYLTAIRMFVSMYDVCMYTKFQVYLLIIIIVIIITTN